VPDDEQNQDDKFGPEAIAARIDKIGEESDADRIAREEEQKLLQRRKAKKSGLEAAASKRLAKIGETAVKRPTSVGAVDPTADRAARIGKWVQDNRQTFGSLMALAVLGVVGIGGWWYWQDKRTSEASVLLGQALAADHGHIASKEDEDDDEKAAASKQLYPSFPTAAARRSAALAKYRSLQAKYPGTGAAIVSRLAEASLLLDGGEAAAARTAYDDVASSSLAKVDPQVRGRALEGRGFADEALADKDDGNRDKHRDAALADYKALEAVDVAGFKELGLYHQARIAIEKGDKGKAVELLKDVTKRLDEPGQAHAFAYLQFAAEDRLRELDPSALPPKAPKGAGGGGGAGGPDMSDPKIQELIRQLQQKSKGGGGSPIVPAPGAP
jgi:hypothetical protein